jgi:hypothetical protein
MGKNKNDNKQQTKSASKTGAYNLYFFFSGAED